MLEAKSVAEAQDILSRLPPVQAGLIEFEVIGLRHTRHTMACPPGDRGLPAREARPHTPLNHRSSGKESLVSPETQPSHISLMLAVPDAHAAVEWYESALGARLLWSLGSVAGMELEGAAFFLAEPDGKVWSTPQELGTTTARVELFCDDPDGIIKRALQAGATGSLGDLRDHERPWGVHRQGVFTDPFGHIWFVGDRTPLAAFPT
jgi:PhnB protein